jgi:predicted dinucleotide-binding enzyme
MPPSLTVCNTDSLGEQIQRAFPAARVVKALNTVNAQVMVDPAGVGGGDHDLFVCGDDAEAKRQVTDWLGEWFGWRNVVDLGDISTARGTEMLLPLWVRLWAALGTPRFNLKVVR